MGTCTMPVGKTIVQLTTGNIVDPVHLSYLKDVSVPPSQLNHLTRISKLDNKDGLSDWIAGRAGEIVH